MDRNQKFGAQFSESMPVELGDPRRTRRSSYQLYGLENSDSNEWLGRGCYCSEWERGGPNQNKLVSNAAIYSGFGDHSNRLRALYAIVVSNLFESLAKRGDGVVNYAECGAGMSTKFLFEELQRRGFDLERVFSYLIEPSAERLKIATDYLTSLGLKGGENFVPIIGRNFDMRERIEPRTIDVSGSLATDHHDPNQSYPRRIEVSVMKLGGMKVNFEWCPPTCYHPRPLYQHLFSNEELDAIVGDRWPKEDKERDRTTYTKIFPACLEPMPALDSRDMVGLEEIMRYWTVGYVKAKMEGVEQGWLKQKGDPNDIFVHEAHTTSGDLIQLYKSVGFLTESGDISELIERSEMKGNPHFLLKNSGILAGLLAQKPY